MGEINPDRVDHSLESDTGVDEEGEHICCRAIERVSAILAENFRQDDPLRHRTVLDEIEEIVDEAMADETDDEIGTPFVHD